MIGLKGKFVCMSYCLHARQTSFNFLSHDIMYSFLYVKTVPKILGSLCSETQLYPV